MEPGVSPTSQRQLATAGCVGYRHETCNSTEYQMWESIDLHL